MGIWISVTSIGSVGGIWERGGESRVCDSGGRSKDSGVSFGISITLLPGFSLNSGLFSLSGLSDNIGISVIAKSIWVSTIDSSIMSTIDSSIGSSISSTIRISGISIGVWEGMVVSISHSWCLDFNGLDLSSLDNWVSVGIWVVKSIGKIVGVGLWISASISFTLLSCFSLNSRCCSFNGSSGSSDNWESMSPNTTIVKTSIRIGSIWMGSIGESCRISNNWSSLNLSRLNYNGLDNRQMTNSMVSPKSINKWRPV